MLAATYTPGVGFAVADTGEPQPGPHEMRLSVRATSICATDLKIIRNGHWRLAEGQRIVLGHEFVGTIDQVGDQVTGYTVGMRVGLAPNAGCGHCGPCVRGRSNYCPNYTAFGINRDGAHTRYVIIPAVFVTQGNVVPLPDSMTDVEASLLEPFSCVVNGLRTARLELGDTVVIYGAGPMGLLHVMLCRVAGAARIVVVDPLVDRLDQARALGCDVALEPGRDDVAQRILYETHGRGADLVVVACSVPEVQAEAVQLLAPCGRLSLFGGLPKGSGRVALDTDRIHYKNLSVTGSTGGSVEDYRIALRLVAGKRVDLARLVSHLFALDSLEEGYRTALAGAAGKIVFLANPWPDLQQRLASRWR